MSDLDADTPHSCSASGHQTTKSGKDFRQGIYICNHNPGARRWCAFQRIPTAIKIKLAQKKKTFPFVISLHSILLASSSSSPSIRMSHALPGVMCAPTNVLHFLAALLLCVSRVFRHNSNHQTEYSFEGEIETREYQAQACLHELRVAYDCVRLRSRVCF